MDKLEYCISLRENGYGSTDIKKKMIENGFEESEIQNLLKESDDIFLNQLNYNGNNRLKRKISNSLRMTILTISLCLLIVIFLGYIQIGLILLIVIWTIFGAYGSFSKRKKNVFINSRFRKYRK